MQKEILQIFCLYCTICVQLGAGSLGAGSLGAGSLRPMQLNKFPEFQPTGSHTSPLIVHDITLTNVPWNHTKFWR